MQLQKAVNLSGYHTFGTPAHTAWFAEATDRDMLIGLIRTGITPVLVIGEGSNMLFTTDFPGLMIKNSLKGRALMPDPSDPDRVVVEVASGENWHAFVLWTLEQGLGGLENLSLIPGTTGAAPIQNIGAYGVELSHVLTAVEVVDRSTGTVARIAASDCGLGYRTSRFKHEWKDKYIILRLFFSLSCRNHVLHTAYGELESRLAGFPRATRTPKQVSDAVIAIRQSKLPDPAVLGNAGSFFKNPEIDRSTRDALLGAFPDLVHFALPGDRFKVPAAWLIEKAGWKGRQVGRVACHHQQPLVIVNTGGASGAEILAFARELVLDIRTKFGILLEPEVNIYPPERWSGPENPY